jgi:hypothetical protein
MKMVSLSALRTGRIYLYHTVMFGSCTHEKKRSTSLKTDHRPHHPLHNIASTCSRHSSWTTWLLKTERIGRPKKSSATKQRCVTSKRCEDLNYTMVEAWNLSTENILHPQSFETQTIQPVPCRFRHPNAWRSKLDDVQNCYANKE